MDTGSNTEETAGAKSLSGACGEFARGNQAQGTVATDKPSESSDVTASAVAEQQTPGKLKKTAFKLFSGRSICTLPSFFGGKSKGQGKGSSKKSISKSKTFDGISDAGRVCSRKDVLADNVPLQEADSECQSFCGGKSLTSSWSAHCVTNSDEVPLPESSENIEKKANVDKSLSFPRPKKGLKGLLSSIRRHKKNKTVDPEKGETYELSADVSRALHTGKMSKVQGKASVFKPDLCEKISDKSSKEIHTSCTVNEKTNVAQTIIPEKAVDSDFAKTLSQESVVQERIMQNSNSSMLDGKTDFMDNDLPSVHSSDQISLIFGDVASLKSFDSLTGCGDIIADRDDESIAESTVSAERSRNAAKRSSCLVTYQGGGEEMATPDEVGEEYLQELWEHAASADACYDAKLQTERENTPQTSFDDVGISGLRTEIAHPYTRTVAENGELLTPQSDQQESAPNSDEGYYDSTTPGPDDEGVDSFTQIKKERLPRDSYSGDALYEFYEPEDNLSPSFEDEPSLESQPLSPKTIAALLNFNMPIDKNLAIFSPQKSQTMQSEEERFAQIQQQLLCWDLKKATGSSVKELNHVENEKCLIDKRLECNNTSVLTDLIKKQLSYLPEKQPPSHNSYRFGKGSSEVLFTGAEKQHWIGLKGANCLSENRGQTVNESCNKPVKNKPSCDSDVGDVSGQVHECSHHVKELNNHSECTSIGESGKSTKDKDKDSALKTEAADKRTRMESECEHAMNFSQALVEFTSNCKLFPDRSASLGSSDSSSSFTDNLPALPTMVTFDVVDVENEGECDRQIEIGTDDDIAESFETFDESYIQKESLAECGDRMFHVFAQKSFLSSSWGVASLPRHLGLYKMSPSMPALLSLNRRSRSLDTDNLDFELADLFVSKGDLWLSEI
uniref:APC membrane recruitment protein 1 n=1 Tax=Latimeria chalumnae TaxID=7897 RepID=H3B799_LATCH